uniref:Uncharacterized protein n=1 Tax=Nelumbo nucifera TaxID=4432 RepID=A0A822ZV39_NELNU|nr:TPA_asm: hypothetical protein HUJ06_017328 [Nelumbo nucifera]
MDPREMKKVAATIKEKAKEFGAANRAEAEATKKMVKVLKKKAAKMKVGKKRVAEARAAQKKKFVLSKKAPEEATTKVDHKKSTSVGTPQGS